MATSKVSMKLLINTQDNKVLFAEAGKECVDFLFHILTLPIATVIRLLKKEGMVGSLSNLYDSVENLNETYIQSDMSKDSLLKPSVSTVPLFLLEDGSKPTGKAALYNCRNCYMGTYYSDNKNAVCSGCKNQLNCAMAYVAPPAEFGQASRKLAVYGCSSCNAGWYSDVQGINCGKCNNQMNKALTYVAPPATARGKEYDPVSGFVKGVVTYMVMDDLVVKPMSTISSLTLLNQFKVKDIGSLKEKEVNITMKEAVMLLKASLHSKNVLTDVFLGSN